MNLTTEKIIGTKFEIWLETYFKSKGCLNVRRNVEFHKSRYLYRQADLTFSLNSNGNEKLIIVEAKYSSNGPIKYDLRQGFKFKAGSNIITNLVDEIIERQKFVGAYSSILVTNKYFDDRLRQEAAKQNVLLFDRERLFADYKRLGGNYSNLEKSINAIDVYRYDLNKHIIKI